MSDEVINKLQDDINRLNAVNDHFGRCYADFVIRMDLIEKKFNHIEKDINKINILINGIICSMGSSE